MLLFFERDFWNFLGLWLFGVSLLLLLSLSLSFFFIFLVFWFLV